MKTKGEDVMKKFLVVLLAVMMVFTFAACGGGGDDQPATGGERTTLTVGFDAEYPPYGFRADDGSYVGYDLDLAQEVCNRNGWELIKKPIDWASKDMELNSGSIDVIWNGFTINGREDDYTWVGPYVNNSIVMVVKADSGITDASQLAGKNVVTQAGSSALSALTNDPGDGSNDENLALTASFATLDQVPDYNSAFLSLESGIYSAIAVDVGVANYQLASRDDGKFVILEKPVSAEQYGIGFKLGNTELADKVKATLDEMWADGTFMEITEKAAEAYDTPTLPDAVCYGE